MLEKNYQKYKDQVEFVFVYIREAHPADSNWSDPRLGLRDPRDLKERNTVAGKCMSDLKMSLPMVVDDMADTVNMRYRAWPERIYVINEDGVIAYKSGIGPWGFKPGEAMRVVRRLLNGEKVPADTESEAKPRSRPDKR